MGRKIITKPEKTTKSDYSPYKKKLFQTYILWYSIPYSLRKMRLKEVEELGFDIKNSLLKELLEVNSDMEFAKYFGMSNDTLTLWKKREDFWEKYDKLLKENVMRFKKDVDFSFTQKTIKHADAPRVKLWKQVFEGWTEKSETQIKGELGVLLEDISTHKQKIVKDT